MTTTIPNQSGSRRLGGTWSMSSPSPSPTCESTRCANPSGILLHVSRMGGPASTPASSHCLLPLAHAKLTKSCEEGTHSPSRLSFVRLNLVKNCGLSSTPANFWSMPGRYIPWEGDCPAGLESRSCSLTIWLGMSCSRNRWRLMTIS